MVARVPCLGATATGLCRHKRCSGAGAGVPPFAACCRGRRPRRATDRLPTGGPPGAPRGRARRRARAALAARVGGAGRAARRESTPAPAPRARERPWTRRGRYAPRRWPHRSGPAAGAAARRRAPSRGADAENGPGLVAAVGALGAQGPSRRPATAQVLLRLLRQRRHDVRGRDVRWTRPRRHARLPVYGKLGDEKADQKYNAKEIDFKKKMPSPSAASRASTRPSARRTGRAAPRPRRPGLQNAQHDGYLAADLGPARRQGEAVVPTRRP